MDLVNSLVSWLVTSAYNLRGGEEIVGAFTKDTSSLSGGVFWLVFDVGTGSLAGVGGLFDAG